MIFKYTICYPDTEKIDVFATAIDGHEALRLLKTFNWEEEIQKPVEFYSPSLDFRRLSDKNRLIFSALGSGRLEGFQMMFILPKDKNFENVFDEKNYRNSIEYVNFVEADEAQDVLDLFIKGDDDKLIAMLSKGKAGDGKNEAHSGGRTESNSTQTGNQKKPQLFSILVTILFKLLGLMLVVFIIWVAIVLLETGDGNVWVIGLLFGLALLFAVATVKFKVEF